MSVSNVARAKCRMEEILSSKMSSGMKCLRGQMLRYEKMRRDSAYAFKYQISKKKQHREISLKFHLYSRYEHKAFLQFFFLR